MRLRTGRLGWLLALALLLAPAAAFAQQENNNYEVPPPDPNLPIPIGPQHYEDGGFFVGGEVLYYWQSNPMGTQTVARRGFVDASGALGAPGTFIGSGTEALNVGDLGPTSYEPGFTVNLGWRFKEGAVVSLDWWHLANTHYSATASLVPRNFAVGPQTADSFLFSPVFNFPIQYAGPDENVVVLNAAGNPINHVAFGIWDAASLETIDFIQRFDKVDITGRIPVYETDCWRSYALFGSRAVIMWERFGWRTVNADNNGVATNVDVANYYNIVSERMYGAHAGCGNEWYLGSNPLGALSVFLDLDAALLMNFVKERSRYQLGDKSTAATRNRNEYTFVPEVQGSFGFMWYPTQAIQLKVAWDAMAFFNTVASPTPIDFNYGALDPTWVHGITRIMHGVNAGIMFVF